jgi:hypothetical protein
VRTNETVSEYSATITVDKYGVPSNSYTLIKTYKVYWEAIGNEIALRQYGYQKDVNYRMFSTFAPTLGNYVKYNSDYYLIVRVIAVKPKTRVHHYESLLTLYEPD